MRYLILSDIHANWDALEAVLADADGAYDRIVCCGDVVGYGGEPNRTTDWLRTTVRDVVRGNHDKAATGSADIEWFNPVAKHATLWTQRILSEENHIYLNALPQGPLRLDGFQLVHGSPLDEDDYIVSTAHAAQLHGYIAGVTFFGHSHLQGGFLVHSGGATEIDQVPPDAASYKLRVPESRAAMINPGSVGQPRDRDARAAYVVYEPEDQLVDYRRVSYDIEAAQRKIVDAGLPEVLAYRLSLGA